MFFIPTLFLSILLPYAGAYDIRHVNSDGAILIESSPTNYAISSTPLIQNGWKTVSVNGDNIVILAPNCQAIVKSSQTLTDVERNLISSTKNQLGASGVNSQWGQRSPVKYSSTRFTSNGISSQVAMNGMSNNNFNSNGASITKNDDGNYSIARPGLPNNLARVFLNNDVATFVYLDGQIQMKPIDCLQPSEQQLLQQLRLEVKQAEEQFRLGMRNFQQNMQMMSQNLNHNMQMMNQNMHRNMLNMNRNLHNSMQGMHQSMNANFGTGYPSQAAYNGYSGQQMLSPVNQFQAQQQLTNNMLPTQSANAGALTLPNPTNAYNPFPFNMMQTNPFGSGFPFSGNFGFNG